MKPIYWVLTAVAVGGAIVYYRNKKASTSGTTAIPATGVIERPIEEDQRIIKLPDSLIEKTSGNTGIMPPAILNQAVPIKVGQPLPPSTNVRAMESARTSVKVVTSSTSSKQIATMPRGQLNGVAGLGNAYILN